MILCPTCLTPTTHRSRVRLLDLPWLLILFRPYRCMGCYRRFYKFYGFGDQSERAEETPKEP
jgi:hypothetical protein